MWVPAGHFYLFFRLFLCSSAFFVAVHHFPSYNLFVSEGITAPGSLSLRAQAKQSQVRLVIGWETSKDKHVAK